MQLFVSLESDEAIEVKRRSPQVKVEKHADGMGQDFANQPMLEVPEVMPAYTGDRKAVRQVRADGFHPLAQARADLQEGGTMGRGHAFAGCGHNEEALPVRQQGLAKRLDKALVGGNPPAQPRDQVLQQLHVVGPGRQEWTPRNPPAAGNPPAQLEAIVTNGASSFVKKINDLATGTFFDTA